MRAVLSVLLVALVGCSSGLSRAPVTSGPQSGSAFLPATGMSGPATPIKHVVIIVQENRTVDNLFAGFPNADTRLYGTMSNGKRVRLQSVSLKSADIDNTYGDSLQSYDGGKMDGFDKTGGRLAYSYVNRTESAPYWSMAREFALADHMFPTMHGQSWTAHLDLIAATTNLSPSKAMVDFPSESPWNCQASTGTITPTIDSKGNYAWNGPFPCFTTLRTMADTLDAAHVSWRYYAPPINGDWPGAWSAFAEIKSVRYGPDWKNVITPPPTILKDVRAGKLAAVTWVTPDWNYSDHAGTGASLGPSWVAAVVNTIGKSQFWDSTAIVVVWDDYGGWYDHRAPPQLDFKGLGIRVPCIIISPYVHAGSVVHTQYEFGSVLRFVEQTFNLPLLGTAAAGYSDARAHSLIDAFDFTQRPLTFKPIPAPVFPYVFLRMQPSGRVPDN